jgi:predicted AlkP superfamily pyrophosphatase or phosphodiesterase
MSKVVLILCDALRDDVAAAQMGYLEHMVERSLATRYTAIAEMPTMSRPNYETVHTGVPCSVHGITSNYAVRLSNTPNIFSQARAHGRTTAASAFYWFSELYNGVPFDPVDSREVDDERLNIQHGRFYGYGQIESSYPDVEVFAAGGMLARRFYPDYLLIHPMMMDSIGERMGGDSTEYRRNAIAQDVIMANLIPALLAADYHVIVTSDHGMNDDPSTHGGSTPQVRNVPLYLMTPAGKGAGNTHQQVSQLQFAPTVCRLLDVPIPETMTALPIVFG